MKRILCGLILGVVLWMGQGCAGNKQDKEPLAINTSHILDDAALRLRQSLEFLSDTNLSPRTVEEGQIRFVQSRDWTSGFFPGMLWLMYEYTRDTAWVKPAHHYSMNLEQEQYNGGTHDMGFKLYNSFGNGYRLTHDTLYKAILLQGASTLITRFNPVVGCIRSWDHNSDKWDFPVIIDNMMNLELLFWATRETGDSSFYNIALKHAETTMKNHIRDDHSSFHVIGYDPLTGEVVKRNTHQGYSHGSAWTRGQAWGLYGYTMTYRETGEEHFLDLARDIARYMLDHPRLPSDKIPYWDFDAPGQPDIPRDVSAAAVMASALYELSTYCQEEGPQYVEVADQILSALSSEYTFSGNQSFPFLLGHSTGSFPHNSEIDVPIIYADYYYLEALLRKTKLSGDWEGAKADIIIKVDDLRFDSENVVPERWSNFVSYMEEQQLPAAIGLICESLERGTPEYDQWIIHKQETGMFEFWNHGYDHSKGTEDGQVSWEFRNRSREAQKEHLLHSQELARQHLGFELLTFGAPYNKRDQVTADILEEMGEIAYWFYPPDEITTAKNRLERTRGVGIEYPVHNPSSFHFWNNYYFNSGKDILVIQGHPNSWDSARFKEFARLVQYLKNLEVEVILPRDSRPKS